MYYIYIYIYIYIYMYICSIVCTISAYKCDVRKIISNGYVQQYK